jgi:dTDP-glucose 4,6-dehydratase
MRCVVTGGAGFIGSHLCERLVRRGHSVLCLDNLLTGREENLASLRGHRRFAFRLFDITHPIHVEGRVDAVLHLASPASPADFARHAIHIMKVGSLGTLHALGLAKAKGARFLLASTSEVYGDPEIHPQRESYWGHVNPIGPRGVYDEAKRFAEALAMAYHRTHGVAIRIARIFNTYGPRMRLDDGRSVCTFVAQALRGEPLTVYGRGTQTRSFCYVDDLVRGLEALLRSGTTGPINLGNPLEIPVERLAREIIRLAGSSSRIVHVPLPPDDPKRRRPDISRARRLLRWEPRVPRAEGLRRTIEDFRARLAST